MGEGRPGYQGHRVAGQHAHAAPGRAGKILREDHVPGGAAVHQPRASRSRHRQVPHGARRPLPRRQGTRWRNPRVSFNILLFFRNEKEFNQDR